MALAIVSLLALAACSSDDGDEVDRRLAESFLRNSPTFRFDGLPQSVELIDRADGDCETTDLPLAAAVTPHEAIISIEEGLVTGARIDSIWDVIEQSPIVRTTTAEDGSQDSVSALLDSPFELHIGQEAVVGAEGLKITFVDVSEDSRCPAATNCVVSGLAKVRLDVIAGERPLGMHEFVLDQRTIGGTARGIGQYVFSMRELNPYPGTDTAPYAAILVVSKVVAA
ncbi:hypothetical protein GBAR_LOCUS14087 [Geodia barretti]|uniref:Lipoprotein n=1 Tax=Geodia barretti TaxID=519541 RepID=A0AA35WRX9_GEOBA|nr:hypothetical protein GBAR_LOCUS14087 [Geodia barretti]